MSADEDPPQAPDAYASRYMSAEGGVLHERRRMPGWFFGILGFAALVQLVASVGTASLAPAIFALPVLALVALLLSHLRVVLTPEHLHVQYGLWGPRVAVADIVSMRVEPYAMLRFGGFGIRRSLDGVWAYSTPGGNNLALIIEARDGRGGVRKLCVTLDRAHEFKQRIEALQAASRVRVDAGAEQPSADLADEGEDRRAAARRQGA